MFVENEENEENVEGDNNEAMMLKGVLHILSVFQGFNSVVDGLELVAT